MNHWVVHLSYCLEALLSYHLLAIDHCNAQSSIGGFTFMVTLCIEWSQQLSSLPKYLRYTLIARGLLGLSTAISARVKWYVGSKSWVDAEVISPDLRKPKHVVQAAQSIMLSKPCCDFSHSCRSPNNIVGVIGNLGLGFWPLFAWTLFISLMTCCNVAISPTLGSPRPRDSCKCRTPDI